MNSYLILYMHIQSNIPQVLVSLNMQEDRLERLLLAFCGSGRLSTASAISSWDMMPIDSSSCRKFPKAFLEPEISESFTNAASKSISSAGSFISSGSEESKSLGFWGACSFPFSGSQAPGTIHI